MKIRLQKEEFWHYVGRHTWWHWSACFTSCFVFLCYFSVLQLHTNILHAWLEKNTLKPTIKRDGSPQGGYVFSLRQHYVCFATLAPLQMRGCIMLDNDTRRRRRWRRPLNGAATSFISHFLWVTPLIPHCTKWPCFFPRSLPLYPPECSPIVEQWAMIWCSWITSRLLPLIVLIERGRTWSKVSAAERQRCHFPSVGWLGGF